MRKMLNMPKRKNVQQVQSAADFAQKNSEFMDSVIEVNNQIKNFAIHLEQYCEVTSDGEPVDVSANLLMIVNHMEQMNFVFSKIKELK